MIGLFAVDNHWFNAFRDHCFGHIYATSAGNLDPLASANPHLVRKLSRNFDKRFGHKLLFQNADWLVTPQDRIGLVGANGTGKSTLMKILAGLETDQRSDCPCRGR